MLHLQYAKVLIKISRNGFWQLWRQQCVHIWHSCTFASFLALPVQCPAHDVRYDSSGVILSPGWPESYPNLQMCSWSINVEKGYNVTITFENFHTEREFDVLEIFDGNRPRSEIKCKICLSYILALFMLILDWKSIATNEISTVSIFFLSVVFLPPFCHPLSQAPHPTVQLWRLWAVTCPHPLISQLLATSF